MYPPNRNVVKIRWDNPNVVFGTKQRFRVLLILANVIFKDMQHFPKYSNKIFLFIRDHIKPQR